MTVLADDDVVVDRDAEGLCGVDNHLGHVDIGPRRRGIAGGMIVDEDQGCGRKLQRPPHNLARIDRRMIDRAPPLNLVGDQCVALV